MTLSKSIVSYGAALVINRAASFLLLPILTSALTPDIFGALSLLQLFYMAALMFSVHGLDEASIRFGISQDNNNSQFLRFILRETSLFTLFTIPILLLTLVYSDVSQSISPANLLPLLLWIFADALYVPSIAFCRAINRTSRVVWALITQGLLTWVLTWLSVSKFNLSINGILLSYAAASFIPLPILLKGLFTKENSKSSIPIPYKTIRKFAWPAGLISIIAIGINFSDRYIIAKLSNTYDTGLYSAGFRIGMVVAMAVSALRMAWYPSAYRQLEENSKSTQLFKSESLKIITILGVIAVFISFLRHQITGITILGKSLISPEYENGLIVIPIIALAFVFDGASTIADTALYFKQKMRLLVVVTLSTLTIKVVLCIILVPRIGIQGAALSTLIAFIFQAIAFEILNKIILKCRILSKANWFLLASVSVIIMLTSVYHF
jgi:O-antigen/teichoic acid export membrane protein